MNEILLDYVKTCREAGYTDSQIVDQLLQVGWSRSDIEKCTGTSIDSPAEIDAPTAATPAAESIPAAETLENTQPVQNEKQKSRWFRLPQFKLPKIKKNGAKPMGVLKGKLSNVKLGKLKPRISFLFKNKKNDPAVNSEGKDEVITTVSDDQQVVMGPDGHKYYVYYYPVPEQLEEKIPVSNPQSVQSAQPAQSVQVNQPPLNVAGPAAVNAQAAQMPVNNMPGGMQPYYIPMPGQPNMMMPSFMPYPMYGYPMYPQMQGMQPNMMQPNAYPPGMYPPYGMQPEAVQPAVKKKASKFWDRVDLIRRAAILIVLVVVIGYVANYFLQLRQKAAEFNSNADSQTTTNFETLRDKIQTYYQKNKKLPTILKEVDSDQSFSTNSLSSQAYDYKIVSSTSFQLCTVFNSGGSTYQSGYACQPYEVNTLGMITAGTLINPADDSSSDSSGTSNSSGNFAGCTNPVALLSANAKCNVADNTNCHKYQFTQEFGMSSVAISNTKDRVAQILKLPSNQGVTMLTEFDPYILSVEGSGSACVAIYETEFDNDPLSGRVIAEYKIPLASLEKEAYNKLFINPVAMVKDKSYSLVFSMLTDDSSVTFARGMELSSYNDGTAYYLKRSEENCTSNCTVDKWVNRDDDLKFMMKFF